MSEISRSEAIKKLNCHLKNNGYCDCDKCSYETDASIVETLNKAISDMEKLEKIEAVLEHRGGYANEIVDCIKTIEQIVKG